MDGVRRPLPLQLEDDHARVVARREQVQRRVRGDDPETVVLTPGKVGLQGVALGQSRGLFENIRVNSSCKFRPLGLLTCCSTADQPGEL